LINRYYIENSLTAEALLAQQFKPAKQRKHLLQGGWGEGGDVIAVEATENPPRV
jgi:hypothetical protein